MFVTILGFVLEGDPGAQKAVENSVLSQFPIIGGQIHTNALQGQVVALVVGIVTSLLGGMGVTQASQNAFDHVWAVPFKNRPNFWQSRLRGLAAADRAGSCCSCSRPRSPASSPRALGGTLLKVVGILISLLLNFALFLAAFRLLTSASVGTSELWPGVFLAGVLWELLQLVGGYYIAHVFKHATSTYGTFGLVIALLVWLHLGAQVTIYSAELNVVVSRRLWPRSLMGPPSEPADKETLTALAKVEERHEQEQIDVEFNN